LPLALSEIEQEHQLNQLLPENDVTEKLSKLHSRLQVKLEDEILAELEKDKCEKEEKVFSPENIRQDIRAGNMDWSAFMDAVHKDIAENEKKKR